MTSFDIPLLFLVYDISKTQRLSTHWTCRTTPVLKIPFLCTWSTKSMPTR